MIRLTLREIKPFEATKAEFLFYVLVDAASFLQSGNTSLLCIIGVSS